MVGIDSPTDDEITNFIIHNTSGSSIQEVTSDLHGMINDIKKSSSLPLGFFIGFPEIIKNAKVCECGAKHTSNPNYHLSWCAMSENK